MQALPDAIHSHQKGLVRSLPAQPRLMPVLNKKYAGIDIPAYFFMYSYPSTDGCDFWWKC